MRWSSTLVVVINGQTKHQCSKSVGEMPLLPIFDSKSRVFMPMYQESILYRET